MPDLYQDDSNLTISLFLVTNKSFFRFAKAQNNTKVGSENSTGTKKINRFPPVLRVKLKCFLAL